MGTSLFKTQVTNDPFLKGFVSMLVFFFCKVWNRTKLLFHAQVTTNSHAPTIICADSSFTFIWNAIYLFYVKTQSFFISIFKYSSLTFLIY
jgi:hypothetical protein